MGTPWPSIGIEIEIEVEIQVIRREYFFKDICINLHFLK